MHTVRGASSKMLCHFSASRLNVGIQSSCWTLLTQPSVLYSSEGVSAQENVSVVRTRSPLQRRGRPKSKEFVDGNEQSFDISSQTIADFGMSGKRSINKQRNIVHSASCYSGQDNLHSTKRNSSQCSIVSQLLDDVGVPQQQVFDDAEFPSDDVTNNNRKSHQLNHAAKRDQTRHAFRPEIDPSSTSIFLFPGQGSQFVGMGAKLLDYPNVADMYKVASHILGFDLLDMCLHGPKDDLNKTINSQPAVLVTSLAAVEKLKHEYPKAIENCVSASGYNVGEYAALVFAGAMTFDDAVRLVKIRAASMQAASHVVSGGMITVQFGASGKVKFACHAAKLYCQQQLGIYDAVCEITGYLYPGCKILSGHREALEFIERNRKEFGINRIQHLPVSGAFHSRLMHSTTASMSRALASVHFSDPIIPVHSNVTALRYQSAQSIGKLLTEQIWRPLRWEQTMHVLYGRPIGASFPQTFEVGPGKQMGNILRLINAKAFEQYSNVDV
jgi:[acyl-carrier-protein] S-malonyltransferase